MAHSNSVRAESASLNRREFLYYALGGSMVLAAGGAGVGLVRYIAPWYPDQYVTLKSDELPSPNSAQLYDYTRFYIARGADGLGMFRIACTYKGCIVKWVKVVSQFQCPCCGSKFEIDGTFVEGPARRSLDRYFTDVTFVDGTTATSNENGDPIPLLGREIASVTVDTRRLIPGPARET